jgi:hypothetical protein
MPAPRKKQVEEVDDTTTDLENSILSQFGEEEEEDGEIEETEGEEEEEEEETEDAEGDVEEESDEDTVDVSADAVRPDKKGNLIDPKTGKIVAPSGPARRFYEDLHRTRAQLNETNRQFNENRQLMGRAAQVMTDMKAKIDAFEGQNNLPQQLGLSPDEHAEALQFMAKFKNPSTAVDAIKLILTRAAQRGINMEGLQQSPLDLSVLTQDIYKKIEDQIAPITNRLKASNEQEEQQKKADAEVQNFFYQNPQARQFAPVLVKMAQRPELAHLSLSESWLMLQNYLLRQRQEPEGGNASPSRPGGRATAGTRASNKPDDSPVTVDASYRDIVKSVVKDHGGLDFS